MELFVVISPYANYCIVGNVKLETLLTKNDRNPSSDSFLIIVQSLRAANIENERVSESPTVKITGLLVQRWQTLISHWARALYEAGLHETKSTHSKVIYFINSLFRWFP